MRRNKSFFIHSAFVVTAMILWSINLVSAATTIYGPRKFVRSTGKPIVVTETFSAPSAATYNLIVFNGEKGKNRVSSAKVKINGIEILRESDFNQQVDRIERSVSLLLSNSISVELKSAPGSFITVSISGINQPPVANAGKDQQVRLGDLVTLDGRNSYDPDGDLITYNWTITSAPSGSSASLSNPTSVMPTFVPDIPGDYIIVLTVNDGQVDSSPDDVVVIAAQPNVAPTAIAGPDQSVVTGSQVFLDGRGSFDPDGDPLTYRWQMISFPVGSTASLDNPASPTPSFLADKNGQYTIVLTVNDGWLDSLPDDVVVISATPNAPPIAYAGDDQTVSRNTMISLNGTASYDPDNNPLAYIWSIVSSPEGSTSQFDDPASPTPKIFADREGDYVFRLVVFDGQLYSAPDTVVIQAVNNPPIADAGPDKDGVVGAPVSLNGSGSSDPNGDTLTYQWSIVSAPGGSTATISNPTSPTPTFTPDFPGTYTIQVVVHDGWVSSAPDTVRIDVIQPNRNPVANPGGPYTGFVGIPVQFNGSGSSDPDGDPITFSWAFGDGAIASEVSPTHTYSSTGTYTVTLMVEDGRGGGSTAQTTAQINNPTPLLSSLSPSSAIAGSSGFTLTLIGDNFLKTSMVSFNGKQVSNTYISKTQIQAAIPSTAITIPGDYPVKVINPTPGGGESNSLNFTVKPSLQITGFSPSEGPVGTTVTITGANFDTGGLRVNFHGVAAVVSRLTNASITSSVPLGATTGPITVTTVNGTATSSSTFTVTSLYDFSLSAAPQNVRVAPGGRATYTVSVSGSQGFSNLVALGAQGLPEGFSGFFSPKTITSGQSSTFTIAACDCSLSSPVTLTITGSASIEGGTVSRSVGVSLEVLSSGITTLTGRVLDTDKKPLRDVTIKVGESSTTTDESGNFVIQNPPTGDQVILIDGFTASTGTAKYPTIPITMNIIAGRVNTLPYIPHLHAQKNSGFTPINPVGETILEDPEIPGFQMRIPAGVNIIGWDGQPNVKVTVRKVPIDALPVPPPPPDVQGRTVYMFYFDKVGGGVPDVPIPVTVPNDLGLPPGEKVDLWYFNESPNINEAPNAWEIAGTGTVSEDGNTISTDPGVGIPRFCCGAIYWAPRYAMGPNIPPAEDRCKIGNFSVEPSTGVFMHSKTDLTLPDRIPINITRYYRTQDNYNGPYGPGTYFGYDWYLFLYGGMVTLVTPPGTRVSFYRQPDGTYINTTEPMYRGAVLTFNPYGRLRMKDGMIYKFDGNGLLIEQEDRNGNKLKFVRGTWTDIDRIIGTDGRVLVTFKIQVSYRDHIIEMTDVQGRKVTYAYGAGGLTSVTDINGGVTQYTYDSRGRMASIIDPRGNTALTVSYDVNGRVCQEQYADGGSHKFYYITVDQASTPEAFKLLKEAEAGGPITAPVCSPVASKSPVAYTVAVDPNGSPTIYRFNSAQKIISNTNANGQTAVINRDPVTNLMTSRADSLGRATSYTHDNKGNMTSMTNPAGKTTFYEYEPVYNLVTRVTDPLGRITRYEYDSRGNMTRIIDPMGQETAMSYDQFGQLTSVRDSLGNTTRFEYDSSGNLAATIDPLGNRVTHIYDAIFRLTSTTNASGRTTTYKYNNLDKVIEITDSMNNVTKFEYDANGNLTRVTDAKNQMILYSYDTDNRLITMRDQLGNFETYEYDVNGNLIRKRDRKGQLTRYSYDDRDRLKRVDYADGSYTENIYDAAGRLIRIDDSVSGSIQYVYSDTGCSTCGGVADRVIKEITPLGSISYTYDALGRRTSMTVAGQPTVSYQYDANSRLAEINSLINGVAVNFSLRYDALGRRTSLTYPNGVTTNYQYDNASNLLDLKHLNPLNQILESINYTYDPNGNRTNMQRANVPVKLPDPKSNVTFNSANQMLTFNDKTMIYDENGNLTSIASPCGTTTYTWDARNRLIGIIGFTPDCQSLTANFKYDALGRRIEKTINGRRVQYLYDGQDIVQEVESGVATVNYIRTLNIDEPLVRVESRGAVRYYQTDALGSVIGLVDENGEIKTIYIYDPFGNLTVSGEASDNPFQYTGRENDGTGLYYYRARYYSPGLQRFISEDPIRFEGGDVNFYGYVQNNPINAIDPEGLLGKIPKTKKCTDLLKKYNKRWEECKKLHPPPCKDPEKPKDPSDLVKLGEYTHWTFDLNEPIRRCVNEKEPNLIKDIVISCGRAVAPGPGDIIRIPVN